jgi:PadR family transcriptional regulator AphA
MFLQTLLFFEDREMMTIKYAMLGFLSWRSLSGYDLKKMFADSELFYWSGNNNQIYRTLVQLHQEGLVAQEVQYQENYPARKVYTITDQGLAELRQWLLSPPELPQYRNSFLVQLAWADQLAPGELDGLLAQYEHELHMQVLMRRERERRGSLNPARTPREAYLWRMLAENQISTYENELAWVRQLRQELASL